MPLRLDPVRRFALGAILWMPATLALWWFVAKYYFGYLLAPLLEAALDLLVPDLFLALKHGGTSWVLRTTLSPVDNPAILLSTPLDPVRYTVAFPLFWGLALAGPIPWREKGYQLLVGTALVVVPAVLLMILLSTLFDLGLVANHKPVLAITPPERWFLVLPFPDWLYHLLGVGRQVSTLVLPLVIPVLAWAGLNGPLTASMLWAGRRGAA